MNTAEEKVMQQVRQVVEEKYPRRLAVLAKRCGWDKYKLRRLLYEGQPVRFGELVTLCVTLGLPLSQLLQQVGA